MSEPRFRHELKYIISDAQLAVLRTRLKGLLPPDPHAGPNGVYRIRSLYLDDYDNSCFQENECGSDIRQKYRIRIYNASSSRISLELKKRQCGMTQKLSCPLTVEQTRMIMDGQVPPDLEHQPPLLRRLAADMLERRMGPSVIVEYDRIPFIYRAGNVRITFDTAIASGKDIKTFLDPVIPRRLVQTAGQQLLEVKFDAFLPSFIQQVLQTDNLQWTSFSKYYLCRQYHT